MPEQFIIGRGNPTEEAILAVIGEMKDGWNINALAMRICKEPNRVSRWLTTLCAAGLVAKCSHGSSTRWCSPANKDATNAFIESAISETKRRALQQSRDYKRRQKALGKVKPRKRSKPAVRIADGEAFTIPPRGVPCSVWALASC